MCRKTYQFSRKKSFSHAYYFQKSRKSVKRFQDKMVNRRILSLNHYSPFNIRHLKYLTKVLKKGIKIWSKEKIINSYGKNLKTSSIDVEYIQHHSKNVDGNVSNIGHFELRNGKEATIEKNVVNECLLRVICAQTGIQPSNLRREIMRKIRKLKSRSHLKNLMHYNPVTVSISMDIIGGARYNGTSKNDAKKILDSSQSGKSHPDMVGGHPRGHASHRQATGIKDSVENYSKNARKTGFFSQHDQDFVTHFVLKTNESKDAMELLNEKGKNGIKEVCKIPAKDLWVEEKKLPKIQDWYNGEKIGEAGRIRDVVVVMKHFYKKYDDDKADVFILTLYPRL